MRKLYVLLLGVVAFVLALPAFAGAVIKRGDETMTMHAGGSPIVWTGAVLVAFAALSLVAIGATSLAAAARHRK